MRQRETWTGHQLERVFPSGGKLLAAAGVLATAAAAAGLGTLAYKSHQREEDRRETLRNELFDKHGEDLVAATVDDKLIVLHVSQLPFDSADPKPFRIGPASDNLVWIGPTEVAFSRPHPQPIAPDIEVSTAEEKYKHSVASHVVEVFNTETHKVVRIFDPYDLSAEAQEIIGNLESKDQAQANRLTEEHIARVRADEKRTRETGVTHITYHIDLEESCSFPVNDIGIDPYSQQVYLVSGNANFTLETQGQHILRAKSVPPQVMFGQTAVDDESHSFKLRRNFLGLGDLELVIDNESVGLNFGSSSRNPAWNFLNWSEELPVEEALEVVAVNEANQNPWERFKNGARGALESVQEFTQKAGSDTAELTEATFDKSVSASEAMLDLIISQLEDGTITLEEAGRLLPLLGKGIDAGLDQLEPDPEQERSATEHAARMAAKQVIPGAGAVMRYGDARGLWEQATTLEQGSDAQMELQETAKRECLLACIEMGLDVSSFGAVGPLKGPLKNTKRVLKILKLTDKASATLTDSETQLLDGILNELLRIPSVSHAMEQILQMSYEELLTFEEQSESEIIVAPLP